VLSLLGALWGFGWVSRRFERQADAFAVRHLTRAEEPGASRVSAGAVEAMAGALGVVADMNGMPVERWDFRHGSIADRQRRLVALEAAPLGRFPIDRVVRRLKVGTVVVLAASIVPIVFEVFMSGG
jgi:STE24 endopeptidase